MFIGICTAALLLPQQQQQQQDGAASGRSGQLPVSSNAGALLQAYLVSFLKSGKTL
jgi:hypothetical protein